MRLISRSLATTLKIGRNLGSMCEPGDVVCLGGDLGAGKTTLVQAIAQGAGVDEDECVNSPTFAILHEYRGILPLYHMDFYRLGSSEDVVALGLEEYLYGDGLALIEWYERAEDVMPESALVVLLSHIDETSREILLHSDDPRWLNKINELAATCG
jgi:tRNA threonylcarbamoyladenosine biosynthesis protein TsaE